MNEYKTGADFWRDTVNYHGREEAAGICGRYLSAQLKTDSEEERKFCHELFIAMTEDIAERADPAKLVYPYSFDTANERIETLFFHEGQKRNEACAHAIDNIINASCYKTNFYNMEIAAMLMIQEYGFPRVNAVLAHNLQRHGSDGRYSRANKEWAQEFILPDQAFDYVYLKAHPILVEDFTKYARKLYEDTGAARFELPGALEAGYKIQNYEIIRSVWFDDKRGFAIGHNPEGLAPYVCWQFRADSNERDFYWGYYCETEKAAADNYTARVLIHMEDESVKEIPNPFVAAEMSTEQNYNMSDGTINNEKDRPDLTDGQTFEGMRELAPETLPEEKPSVLEQIREARKEPPAPHKQKDGHGDLEL